MLEAALSQSHSKVSAASHPLLAPQYLDGGFVDHPLPAPSEDAQGLNAFSTSAKPSLSPSSQKPTISSEEQASPKDRSSASSYMLLTPKIGGERSAEFLSEAAGAAPHSAGRMAVENLLLDEDKAAPEGKREDEWVGENAAPAMIVSVTDSGHVCSETDARSAIVVKARQPIRTNTAKLSNACARFFGSCPRGRRHDVVPHLSLRTRNGTTR